MKRVVPALIVVAAAAILAAVGWAVLGGAERTPPAPPPPDPAPAPVPAPPPPSGGPPVFVPKSPAKGEPAAAEPPAEPPLPPGAYPWEVPGWWHEVDRKFRDADMEVSGETLPVVRILERISEAAAFPVRAGPELAKWTEETSISLASVRAPARAVVETLARRHNLDVVLTAEALLLHQRGRAPTNRVVDAGRVQWALREADERRLGEREADPAAEGLKAVRLELPLEGVALRDAAVRLGERLGIPVYMDATLWNVNPAVRIPEGTRTLEDVLERMTTPFDACFDVTARRVVLFRPVRR